jgi:V/A-type H+-transporting ATPase subunit I
MSIARMSLIEIIVPRAQTMDLIGAIQNFGSLQVEEVPLVVPGSRSFLHRDQLSESQLNQKEKLAEVLQTLVTMQAQMGEVTVPDSDAIEAARATLRGDGADYLLLTVSRLKRKLNSLIRKHANITSDIRSLERYRQRLDELSGLLSAEDGLAELSHWALLVGPADRHQLEILTDNLKRVTQDRSRALSASKVPGQVSGSDVVLLAVPTEYASAARSLISNSDLSELRLPKAVRGLPLAKAVALLQKQGADLPEQLSRVESGLDAFRAEQHKLLAGIEYVCSDTLARLGAIELIAHSDMLTVVHSWIPSGDVPQFEQALIEGLGDTVSVTDLKSGMGQTENIPVRLENPKAFRPFEKLLSLFSVPLYGSYDPTILMAIVFPLFFGMILGDIAYGLILLGLTLWARRRWKQNPAIMDVTSIAIWCSMGTILFGFVYGEFLGDLGHRTGIIPLTLGGFRILPLWEAREEVIDELLVLSIVVGMAHISLGLILGIVESIRMKNRHHMWESNGLGSGLAGLVLLLVTSLAVWLPVVVAKSTGGTFLAFAVVTLLINNGAAGPIELVSLLANILSYCRLVALGVAGMVLANLANSIAAGQQYFIVGALMALPIHALAVALGILEPTIHALRLHYVEFLPKFFIGDGRAYTPLRRKGRRYDD